MRGYGDRFRFRNMRILRLQHQHAVCAKTRGETIRKLSDFAPLILRAETAAFVFHRLQQTGGEANEIVAKTGVQRIGKTVQFFAEQKFDNSRFARGVAAFDHDAAHISIGTEEAGLEPPRAFAAAFKLSGKIGCK